MSRRFIAQMGENEQVEEIFLVAEKQLRANRAGNLYLQLRLADRSGTIAAMLWNANEGVYRALESGSYARVSGKTQYHNAALQIIASRVDPIDPRQVDEAEFFPLGQKDLDRLAVKLAEELRALGDPHLRTLGECFLLDEQFMRRLALAPAGIKHHHAYRGGLLEHTLDLMELTRVVAPRYPDLNADLLLMGAFLHDLGKIEELSYEREMCYSDEGQLVGHLVIGVRLLLEKIAAAERLSGETFPPELTWQLEHLILSHHGSYEFGSPKLPMTLEAVALHYLDALDAKLHGFSQLIREDVNHDSPWTAFHPAIGRKLYKGKIAGPAKP